MSFSAKFICHRGLNCFLPGILADFAKYAVCRWAQHVQRPAERDFSWLAAALASKPQEFNAQKEPLIHIEFIEALPQHVSICNVSQASQDSHHPTRGLG